MQQVDWPQSLLEHTSGAEVKLQATANATAADQEKSSIQPDSQQTHESQLDSRTSPADFLRSLDQDRITPPNIRSTLIPSKFDGIIPGTLKTRHSARSRSSLLNTTEGIVWNSMNGRAQCDWAACTPSRTSITWVSHMEVGR